MISFPEPQPNDSKEELAIKLANAMHGKLNNTGTITLAANAATTTLNDRNIGVNSKILLIPTTANAAAALGTTYQTLPNAKWQAVLNHANDALTDKTFGYVVLG